MTVNTEIFWTVGMLAEQLLLGLIADSHIQGSVRDYLHPRSNS